MSVVNQQIGEPVNGDNTAVVAAADQFDAEGSIVQSYERLKKSRGGFLAHLTRLYNEVEPLMADFGNHQRVEDLSAAIDEQFDKFKAAHVACVAASADDNETSVIEESYNSQATNYTEYKQRVADWHQGRLDIANLHKARAVNTDDPDAASIQSSARSTTASARAREATVKRRLLELKLEQARAEQELEARLQELERQKVILRQQSELIQAREEEKLWHQPENNEVNGIPVQRDAGMDDHGHGEVQNDVIAGAASAGQGYPAVDSRPTGIGAGTVAQGNTRDRTIQSDDSSGGVASGVAWQGRSRGYPTHHPGAAQDSHNRNNNNTAGVSSTQNNDAGTVNSDVLGHLASVLHEGFALPKPELFSFSGNSIDFCKFINNFEVNIEQKVSSNKQRLSYLIQYCTGEVKELIEDCVMLGLM